MCISNNSNTTRVVRELVAATQRLEFSGDMSHLDKAALTSIVKTTLMGTLNVNESSIQNMFLDEVVSERRLQEQLQDQTQMAHQPRQLQQVTTYDLSYEIVVPPGTTASAIAAKVERITEGSTQEQTYFRAALQVSTGTTLTSIQEQLPVRTWSQEVMVDASGSMVSMAGCPSMTCPDGYGAKAGADVLLCESSACDPLGSDLGLCCNDQRTAPEELDDILDGLLVLAGAFVFLLLVFLGWHCLWEGHEYASMLAVACCCRSNRHRRVWPEPQK